MAVSSPQADYLHAGVAVLVNPALWDLVTSFMTGYPLAVHKFAQESDPTTLQNVCRAWGSGQIYLGFSMARGGALPELAIAADNLPILRELFKLSIHHQFKHDPKLNFRKAFRCAVLFNNLRVLEYLDKTLPKGPDWAWDTNLMAIAVKRNDPDLQVLDWVHARVPTQQRRSQIDYDVLRHVRSGNLQVVQWLVEHEHEIPERALNGAAEKGHVEVLRYLYEHSSHCCSSEALVSAAAQGFTDVVQLVIRSQSVSVDAVIQAVAAHDHLEDMRLVTESRARLEKRYLAIGVPTTIHHGDIAAYLYENYFQGRPEGVVVAADRLESVDFQTKKQTKGHTSSTLVCTAQNDPVDVMTELTVPRQQSHLTILFRLVRSLW